MPQRPLSPHLQVYKPQITSVLSITHRLTGVLLFMGALCLGLWLIVLQQGGEVYTMVTAFFTTIPGRGLLILWSFCFFYHFLNGLRYLFWDAGLGFSLTTVRKTGWTVILLSSLGTLAMWLFLLFELKALLQGVFS